jgi:hypothetical protein
VTTTREHRAAPAGGQLTGVRRGVDLAFAVLATAFVGAVLVQVYLAGAGAFAHHTVHHAFAAHEDLGNVLGIAAIVLFVLALVARVNWTTVIGALLLALLTELAQHGLAQAGHDNRWVGGVHAFDGMLILGLATWLALGAWRRR